MITSEVVAKTGLSPSRVRQAALAMGVVKRGRDYDWTDEQVEELMERKGRKGNPEFGAGYYQKLIDRKSEEQ